MCLRMQLQWLCTAFLQRRKSWDQMDKVSLEFVHAEPNCNRFSLCFSYIRYP